LKIHRERAEIPVVYADDPRARRECGRDFRFVMRLDQAGEAERVRCRDKRF
jgi:allophanate hydrolase subunit 1